MNAKRALGAASVLLIGSAATLGLVASRYEPVAAPGTQLGIVPIGGLTKEQAQFRLRQWWETEKVRSLTLSMAGTKDTYTARAQQLGYAVDDEASVKAVEFRDFWESAQGVLDKTGEGKKYPVVFKEIEADLAGLSDFVTKHVKPPKPARIQFLKTGMKRTPEIPGQALDTAKLGEAIVAAIQTGKAELPLTQGKKKVTDEALASIREVYSQYTTHFSEGKATRASNIKLAASKISGIVLAPGDVFSFNGTVGRRTAEAGFQIAGVYKDGKHDVDLGGGICQVSTTLYNSVLLGNLPVVRRSNHSMPVAYVPLGRDATVDYGSIDFQFRNDRDYPIAVIAHTGPGVITFQIYAPVKNDYKVEILASGERSWDCRVKQVNDPSVVAGRTRVIEGGCRGHAVSTTRVVYQGGKEVKRESLGESYYPGATRVVAVGTRQAAPRPTAPAAPPAGGAPQTPADIPDTAPPTAPGDGGGEPDRI